MKKAVMAMWILLLLVAILSPLKTAFAASDGYYQLSAVTYEWDGTDANRTKATNSKYYYTYGDEYSIGYRLPWVVESYGRYYPYIAADTNGNLWFSVGSWRLGNSFDLANSGGPVISAWNNDLSSYYYGGVYIQYKTNPERVVIEWQAETYIEEGLYKPNNFEIVFFKNGDARIDYKSFSTTVGKDFGSGISKGDGVHYINLSTAFDKPFNLAGKSFLFAKLYNVTASTNGNGTITPISTATTYGGSSTFAITPADGYLLTSLTDNGVDVTASVSNNSYTITNVTANHTVMATFNKLICTVSSSVSGGNGSVSPASTTVNSGHNTIVTVTPAPGYRLALLYDNKASVTERVSNNTYTIANVITDHAIVAVFTEITNRPSLLNYRHGNTISP
ncbi:InlB B-repeat-containing protein [Geotalea toluenoxydans]|uniref:InlB B-repeat-containing protein n=1 Tax=Geotalea toluenoxydans TaxID=421624 RepID=UPI0006D03352|nr:hypothetical protein [Geotalea toluenoxydans]